MHEFLQMIKDNYGKDHEFHRLAAKVWVEEWEAGSKTVTIAMGGLSSKYERGIQEMVFVVARWLVDHEPTFEDRATETWEDTMARLRKDTDQRAAELGLSDAQMGAAVNLAFSVYRNGLVQLAEDEFRDRRLVIWKDAPDGAFVPEPSGKP